MVRVNLNGRTEEFTLGSGVKTKCMEGVFSFGLMGGDTTVNTSTIKSTVKVYSYGLMAKGMMVNGRMEYSMGWALIKQVLEARAGRESG